MDKETVASTAKASALLQWFASAYVSALCRVLTPSTRTVPCANFKRWMDAVNIDVTRDIATMPDLGPKTRAALLRFKDDTLAEVAAHVPSCTGAKGTIDVGKFRDLLDKAKMCQVGTPKVVAAVVKPPKVVAAIVKPPKVVAPKATTGPARPAVVVKPPKVVAAVVKPKVVAPKATTGPARPVMKLL